MKTAVLAVFFFGLSALAVKQISAILMDGSIFSSLRQTVALREKKNWWYAKLGDLFACRLCMTTQVSLWLSALGGLLAWCTLGFPVAGASSTSKAVGYIGFVFVGGMALAAAARGVWDLLEYYPKKLECLRRQSEAEQIRTRLLEHEQLASKTGSPEPISFADFSAVLDCVRIPCGDYHCAEGRKACIEAETASRIQRLNEAGKLRLGMAVPLDVFIRATTVAITDLFLFKVKHPEADQCAVSRSYYHQMLMGLYAGQAFPESERPK